jgi:tetratricopeptide (TPR) repeat protein
MMVYAYIELPPPLDGWIDTPEVLFPVRAGEAERLLRQEPPSAEAILSELERYLEDYPAKQARLAGPGAQLALRAAEEMCAAGRRDEASRFYELSLRLRPDDVAARMGYAVALHAAGKGDEALAQCRVVMGQTAAVDNLKMWTLAARIHAGRGEHRQVVELLEPLEQELFPRDAEFWELLGNARAALEPKAFVVVIQSGKRAGQRVELSGQARIGRAPDNEICLPDEGVSRVHALLEPRVDHCVLADNGSMNGTTVNGYRIEQPVQVRAGDVIRCSTIELVMGLRD